MIGKKLMFAKMYRLLSRSLRFIGDKNGSKEFLGQINCAASDDEQNGRVSWTWQPSFEKEPRVIIPKKVKGGRHNFKECDGSTLDDMSFPAMELEDTTGSISETVL